MRDYTHGPRPGFWQMLWRTGGMFPLVLAAFTVILTAISFSDLRDGLDFEARGIEVSAEITDRSEKRVRRDDRWQTEYFIVLLYDADGTEMTTREKVTSAQFDASDIGTSRTIRYHRDAPTQVEFEVGQTLASGHKLRWAALGMGLLTLGALWWTGRSAVDAIRARKFGTIERVTVINVLEHHGKNSTSYRLQWFDKNGDIATSLSSSGRDRYDAYPKHASIEVFRGAKGRAWWIGDVGPRAQAATVPSVGKS